MLFVFLFFFFFFFFKQKTAYEIMPSLVGSEMCIRDRDGRESDRCTDDDAERRVGSGKYCLLYTSDAADDLRCVDLDGRRLIKKKNQTQTANAEDIARSVPAHAHRRQTHFRCAPRNRRAALAASRRLDLEICNRGYKTPVLCIGKA